LITPVIPLVVVVYVVPISICFLSLGVYYSTSHRQLVGFR
jgi:hypothetical protein